MIDSKLIDSPVQVIIDNDDFIQFNPTNDKKFKPTRFRPEGTFSRPIEVLNLIDEINKVLALYHGYDLAVEKIMAFVKVLDDQTKVY